MPFDDSEAASEGPAELKSPLEGERLTCVEVRAEELGAPDEMVFVWLKIAGRLLDGAMPPDENSDIKALPVAVGAIVTLFSCLGRGTKAPFVEDMAQKINTACLDRVEKIILRQMSLPVGQIIKTALSEVGILFDDIWKLQALYRPALDQTW